jgi:predicted TIM-barrel fold metal-dependent hydrolase
VFRRREFVKYAGIGLTGGVIMKMVNSRFSNGGEGDSQHTPGNFVDAHVHIWTDDFQKYPLGQGFSPQKMAPRVFSYDDILHHANPNGVKRIVLVQMSYYGFDNTYMLDAIRRLPEVFRGIAVVDWNSSDLEAKMQGLAQQGVRGFRIYPQNVPAETCLDGEGLDRMFRCGAKENLAMCLLINPDALVAVRRRCENFPDTPVVIDHLARIGMAGPITENDIRALCALAHYPRVKVKVSAFYALGKKKPPHLDLAPLIKRVHEAFEPKRLMWGSDCPFQVQSETYADSIFLLRDRLDFLSTADKGWILRRTAEETFFH